jgi:hypothetical protein
MVGLIFGAGLFAAFAASAPSGISAADPAKAAPVANT